VLPARDDTRTRLLPTLQGLGSNLGTNQIPGTKNLQANLPFSASRHRFMYPTPNDITGVGGYSVLPTVS